MTKRDDPFVLNQWGPAGGYKWELVGLVDHKRGPTAVPLLVPASPGTGIVDLEIKDSLFVDFANLEATADSVAEFANRVSWLGRITHGRRITYRAKSAAELLSGRAEYEYEPLPLVMGETLAHWSEEICRMKRALDLQVALKKKDWELLDSWIRIEPPWVKYVEADIYDGEWRGVVVDFLDRSVEDGQLSKAARKLLQKMINGALSETTHVGLVLDDEKPKERVFAVSLLGVMWLQLLNGVAEDRIGTCAVCSGLLVSSTRSARKHRNDKKTCSSACRQKLSRMKKAQAQVG